jgi:predicted alpha/beta-hydrolase family hydrolase
MADRFVLEIAPSEPISALVYAAESGADLSGADISLIFGHGAGAGQNSPFMVKFATALASRGIETITFNFAYTESGRRVPDRNDRLEAAWRRIIAAYRAGEVGARSRRLAIGGKSMGGRIASQVAATKDERAGDGIAGLVFLGYPLHPPGRPDKLRSAHLPQIRAPMLFVQGSRDAFGTPEELAPILNTLHAPAELCVIEDGDHSFKVRKSAPLSQSAVFDFILDAVERWLRALP